MKKIDDSIKNQCFRAKNLFLMFDNHEIREYVPTLVMYFFQIEYVRFYIRTSKILI